MLDGWMDGWWSNHLSTMVKCRIASRVHEQAGTDKIRDSVESRKRINEAVKKEKAEKELAAKTIVESNLYAL
jgi:hypothetical protein